MKTDKESKTKHIIKPEDRVSVLTKLSYAFGSFSECIFANAHLQLAYPIYDFALGVPSRWIGLALGLPRIWDAVTDPAMGNISDNTRSRFGRRRPYVFIGVVFITILFYLSWVPNRNWSENGLFVYFLVLSILYFTAYTVFSVPYHSLGLELTPDFQERTSVMAYKIFLVNMGSLPAAFLYKTCFWFGGEGDQDTVVLNGAKHMGLLFGGIILVTGLLPALFCKERFQNISQASIGFFKAAKMTLSNRAFLILCCSVFLMIMSAFLYIPFAQYITVSYIFEGDKERMAGFMVWSSVVYGLSGMAWTPVMAWLSRFLGKKRTFYFGQIVMGFGLGLSWFVANPKNPYLWLIHTALISAGWSAMHVMASSMMADICDLDELKSGMRREGMYASMQSFLMKFGLGMALCVTGFIVELCGYDKNLDVQTPQTNTNLRLGYIFIPLTLVLIAAYAMSRYGLTEKHMDKIRSILDRRKARELGKDSGQ